MLPTSSVPRQQSSPSCARLCFLHILYNPRKRPPRTARYIFAAVKEAQGRHLKRQQRSNKMGASRQVALNIRITEMADETSQVIREFGKHHDMSSASVEALLEDFLCILEGEETISHVNVATIMHRTAFLVSASHLKSHVVKNHAKLIERLTVAVHNSIDLFQPRHIANVIWAYGKLGRPVLTILTPGSASVPGVLALLMERAEMLCERFSAREISSVMVGLANMQLQRKTCEGLLLRLTASAARRIEKFKGQELSNVVWSLGRLGATKTCQRTADFLHQLLPRLNPQSLTPQQVSNLLWGFAKLDFQDGSNFFGEVVRNFEGRLDDFSPQGIANLVWSLSKLMYLPCNSFLGKVVSHAVGMLGRLKPQHVSNLLYAFGIFGDVDIAGPLCSAAKAHFEEKKDSFSVQELCNLLWALAMLDALDVKTFNLGMVCLSNKSSLKSMKDSEKRQIYQCAIHLQVFGLEQGLDEAVWLKLQEEFSRVWVSGQYSKPTSAVGLAVLITLQKLGYASSTRFVSGVIPLLVDSATGADGVRVTIEVSIKQHYFVNRKDRLEGPRMWAMRIQEAQGFVVVRVDTDEWTRLPVGKRQDFLMDKLDAPWPH
ncbi:unnamed protein product [Ostreobium quekettii]|uniref:RAP domain-containing protein n=1 Tax=Ostreobium quekettii TaxID=121088 RepID=A0A8S1J0S8_9CHLO|nr:unnamed protein product [Ostreobium quekettii]